MSLDQRTSQKAEKTEYPREVPAERTQQQMDAHEKEDNRSFLHRHPLMVVLVIGSLLLLSIAGYFIWLVYFHPY